MQYYTKYLIAFLFFVSHLPAQQNTLLFDKNVALKNNTAYQIDITFESDTNSKHYFKRFNDIQLNSNNFENIIGLINKFGQKVKLEIPGSNNFYEYNPILIDSGSTLIFSSFNNNSGRGGEDIFISKMTDQKWQTPTELSNLNTLLNEAPLFYSEMNKTLLVYANYASSQGNGDIFKTTRKSENFYEVEVLPSPLNSRFFESDAFLINDSIMVFSSDRPGCIGSYHPKGVKYKDSFWGNTDLFISEFRNGVWGNVKNLGPDINTEFAERTPYLSGCGNILLFSSNGRSSKGLDVYFSFRVNRNSWTEWSTPQSIGNVINSGADEWGLKLDEQTKTLYFTDDKDIFHIEINNTLSEKPLIDINGIVRNEKNQFLEAKIEWGIISEKESFFSLESSSQTGKFSLFLPAGEHYYYSVLCEGYFPLTASLDLTNYESSETINLDIVLLSNSLGKGESVSLVDKFLFDYNKYEIKEEAKPGLSNIVYALKILDNSESWKLNISGHTDSIGSKEYNLVLSEKRAKAVYQFLISQGCDPQKFNISALGETQPIADNSTEEGRAENRRVVLKIIED